MSKATCIMVQGTMSGAGKSLLCAALCRIFAQDGWRVAPFKSQNMALNSFVTRDGLEMGRAQVVQAQAAGVEPDVRMNPILLKPSSDIGSQVIVNGEVRGQMPAAEYFRRKKQLIPDILAAYNSLAEDFDIIVIEGAGSPAEINLKADDIVNMGLAKLVDAPVLLVGDIDRGGVFAQLFGTVELLEPDERARIKGLIINKFRGDVGILRPGLAMLEEKAHLPVFGVVPYLKVDIEDEDSLSDRLQVKNAVKPLDAAIVRLPHISNFTDFMPLEQHPLLGVRYVQTTRELGAPDCVILPGTKNTVDDLLWLRQCGLEAAISKLAQRGTPVLGVCGGYQMLGQTLADPEGTESGRPQTLRGLGLLPTQTTFTAEKRRTQSQATVTAEPFAGAHLTTRSFEPMSKWIEKRTRPVLPLYLAALTWPVASLILPPYRLVNLVIIAALSTVVYLVSSRFCPTRVQRVEQPYATGSENTDAMLNGIAANLDALHKLNDAIPDAELSRQLDRMEKAGHGIVQAVEQKPDKARTVDRFARYYLPEVVKIMSAYAQMEKGGITGENAAQILSEVRRNAGTMATAFENQLDALYSAEAMDISTDIEVLENIMRGQNLT
jgi:adenosylcobyric acid synthase